MVAEILPGCICLIWRIVYVVPLQVWRAIEVRLPAQLFRITPHHILFVKRAAIKIRTFGRCHMWGEHAEEFKPMYASTLLRD
jgi:hypothetical protein